MEKDQKRIPVNRSGSVTSQQRGERPPPVAFNEKIHHQNSGTLPSPPPGFAFPNCVNAYRPVPDPNASSSCYQNFYNFGSATSQQFPGGFGGNAYSNFMPQNQSTIGSFEQPEYVDATSVLSRNQYNKNMTSNGYELDKGLNVLSSTVIQKPQVCTSMPNSNNPTVRKVVQPDDKSNNNEVIKPIIDTIVGSMAMSNGTYTHFGPATSMPPMFQGENVPIYARSEIKDENAVIMENFGATRSRFGGSNESMGFSGTVDSGSRPQTPGKPSYSEILAKNASQNGVTPNGNTFRKVASSPSASPVGDIFQTQPNSVHRKSVDYVNRNVSSNSSAASSSCASASSSPVAKQRTFSQSIVSRLFNPTKGKENNTTEQQNFNNKSSSYSRNTPSATPTHQKHQNILFSKGVVSNDRKVILSQNNAKLKPKSAKPAVKLASGQNSFDFEIEDLDDEDDNDGEVGWKTCTTRGRSVVNRQHNASGGNSSSNSVKRLSNDGNVTGVLNNVNKMDSENNNEDEIANNTSRRESLTEKKSVPVGMNLQSGGVSSTSSSGGIGSQSQFHSSRKGREKEKTKNRKESRNCMVRRIEKMIYLWGATMISAIAWLLKLVTDVFTLSISVGSTLMGDLYSWFQNQALPACCQHFQSFEDQIKCCYRRIKKFFTWKMPFRRKSVDGNNDVKKDADELLAALGPERNITLPTNGDEALKRLLSCKGQDPYSILGVKSNCSDDTIRRYYKKQAVLVHPDKNLVVGAEEAFKILARAFELIGEPLKRNEYHHKLLEAHAKEQVYGEIGKLLEQLRKKMEVATSSIKCTKCNLRHKKNKTDRPLFAARYCAQCSIHHGAREGELWAERKGWFGWSWNYFTCMDCYVWEINEWAKCQKKNLLHIKADSHCVMYRLVANIQSSGQQQGNPPQTNDGHFHVDAEDDWDSLINNLCKSTGGVPGSKSGNHFYQQGKGSSTFGTTGGMNGSSTSNASQKKRKGKRK